jgi:hypothetical protein
MSTKLVVVNRFNGFQAAIYTIGEALGLPVNEYSRVKE